MDTRRIKRVYVELLESRTLLNSYYVSSMGDDAAAGGVDSPWRTLQRAADVVVAGDTVNVLPGVYSGFQMDAQTPSPGTAEAPIVYLAQPGAVINAKNSASTDAIELQRGNDYVVIDGFTIVNATGTIAGAGIEVRNSDHVIIRNNRIDSAGTWGIATDHADDALIENNFISRAQRKHGIDASNSGDRAIIRGNIIWGNAGSGITMNGDASMGGDGIITGAVVENNILHDNGGGAAISCDGVQDSIFRNNLLYNNNAGGIALYEMDGAGPSHDNTIVNNTIIQTSTARWVIGIKDGSTGTTVLNNILYNNNARRGAINIDGTSLAGFRSDYNIVDGRFTKNDGATVMNLAQWQATGQDRHSAVSTPAQLFSNVAVSDYRLKIGSRAINAGLGDAAPANDLVGNSRPIGSGPDIGAYEAQPGAAMAVPAAPSNADATVAGPREIFVTWNDNSDNETGFLIERNANGGEFARIAVIPPNTTAYTDKTAMSGTQHAYRVIALGIAASSDPSNEAATITPIAAPVSPDQLVATAADKVRLTWSDNSNDEAGFTVERRVGPDGEYAPVASLPAGTTAYDDSEVQPGTRYVYRIKAVGTAIDSPYSNEAAAVAMLPTPLGLVARAASRSQLSLRWTDATVNETGYKVYRRIGPTGGWRVVASLGPNAKAYADKKLRTGVQYFYQVKAYNSVAQSAFSNVAGATTTKLRVVAGRIASPSRVVATAAKGRKITVRWTSKAIGGQAMYRLERSAAGGPFVHLATLGPDITSYVDTTVTRGVRYVYRVCVSAGRTNTRYVRTAKVIGK